MLDILFGVLMVIFFGWLLLLGIKAAWSITKFLLFIVFAPIILIVLAVTGMMEIAFGLLIIMAAISVITTVIKRIK